MDTHRLIFAGTLIPKRQACSCWDTKVSVMRVHIQITPHAFLEMEASPICQVIIRATLSFPGSCSIWAGFLPDPCWPGAESN